MLDITVSEPAKHGNSTVPGSAYVNFKISTKTNLAHYSATEFFVRRRFRDFVWLRSQLCAANPGVIVPPLPPVDSFIKDDRFSTEFTQRRQAGLELFLCRVAGHPQLSKAADLQTFLEAKARSTAPVGMGRN